MLRGSLPKTLVCIEAEESYVSTKRIRHCMRAVQLFLSCLTFVAGLGFSCSFFSPASVHIPPDPRRGMNEGICLVSCSLAAVGILSKMWPSCRSAGDGCLAVLDQRVLSEPPALRVLLAAQLYILMHADGTLRE